MKAARIHEYGAAPVMDEVPVPDAGPDEVLVRIKAASNWGKTPGKDEPPSNLYR